MNHMSQVNLMPPKNQKNMLKLFLEQSSFLYFERLPSYHKRQTCCDFLRRSAGDDFISSCISGVAIMSMFGQHTTVQPISKKKYVWNKWLGIVQQFREQHEKILELQPSGSARKDIEHDWPLYEDMLWMKPFIDHLPQASNVEDSSQDPDQTG
ncbi:hypothetical protein QAD02_000686 [Eretmocerus hayati]|uniref:Uncharacterized protein n=1 Tax=Eretmocerus hayati TaxID=131215 RepID=A0ACC2NEA0_9HYME|nr:hypothetical protein QAD02_000686 [Eretmocerus hayati]